MSVQSRPTRVHGINIVADKPRLRAAAVAFAAPLDHRFIRPAPRWLPGSRWERVCARITVHHRIRNGNRSP
jgi:hypothetical protein